MEELKTKVASLENKLEVLEQKYKRVCYLLHVQLESSTAKKVLESTHKIESAKFEVEAVKSDYASSKQMLHEIIGKSNCPTKVWERAISDSIA